MHYKVVIAFHVGVEIGKWQPYHQTQEATIPTATNTNNETVKTT